ncbi:hypothetical protein Dimus_011159, partial [Dionaea muscipula]
MLPYCRCYRVALLERHRVAIAGAHQRHCSAPCYYVQSDAIAHALLPSCLRLAAMIFATLSSCDHHAASCSCDHNM